MSSFFRFFAFGATFLLLCSHAFAAPVSFHLPAQACDASLLAFSKQAKVEVLFSPDDLRDVRANAVIGLFEPEEALRLLLKGTGFAARRNVRGKFVVTRQVLRTGALRGRLLTPEGVAAYRVRVTLPEEQLSVRTDENGEFEFSQVSPGTHRLIATAEGYQPLHITEAPVSAGETFTLEPQVLVEASEPAHLAPFVVEGQPARSSPFERSHTLLPPRTAAGNLDLPRTENDALPYTIYERDQITRSGVVTLSEFLNRELLDSGGVTNALNPGADSRTLTQDTSSSPSLRGFNDTDETIILVNGRRLPEVLTAGSSPQPPDVNFIPMSLVEQIQVLPVSAAALYSGNPVGGVINIVLRPDVDSNSTEVVGTYTNTTANFDAPQKTFSLLHSQTLLNGDLRVRVNATVTTITPPSEAELGHRARHLQNEAGFDAPLFRATPNVRSADLSPLFGPGSAAVTSVAPGADGSGGLSAFEGREGVRNFEFFDGPGGLAVTLASPDAAYGRTERRTAYFVSTVYDATPWLQLAIDATYAETNLKRGFDILTADLTLDAASALNPFGQDVRVSLTETTPGLGENYSEGRLRYTSLVGGALLKLPADWRVSLDVQYGHNVSEYRGISGADMGRWQQLVDAGRYNPLRDTQLYGPPQEFYDRVLIYRGRRGDYVTLGSYDTVDGAVRVTHRALPLPTGPGSLNLGADYRLNHMDKASEAPHFGDGTAAGPVLQWRGRTLQRYSVFGELQAPLLPQRRLPRGLRALEADLAVRYIASDAAREANVAPTYGLKADFAGGLTLRGSITTSNRLPTPHMSRRIETSSGPSTGVNYAFVTDPRRGGEAYEVVENNIINPQLSPESAVTQTAGAIFQRGKDRRFRATIDFVDTRKTDELVYLDPAAVLKLEALFPERVTRAPLAPGDPAEAGRIKSVLTGVTNMAWRHSQHWNLSLNYAQHGFFGGTFDAYARLLYYQRYDRQVTADSEIYDELSRPSGSSPGILRYRASLGTGWSNRHWGFGLDAYYYHSRIIPDTERAAQGSDRIDPFWQVGAYVQSDLARWLPWKSSRYGLRGQLRVNNLFNEDFPRYASEPTGAGVQAYGDWRGRTYSVSVTANF